MNRSWTIATIRGIPIRVHISLIFLLLYVTLGLSGQFHSHFREITPLTNLEPGPLTLPPLAWGLILALGLFVAIILHELAHSFVALSSGARVESITLMMLGGISRIQGEIRNPRREAWMAAAGPLMSLAIAVVAFGITLLLQSAPSDLRVAGMVFAEINLMLAVFNLLPAFPMDGGRILRAALTPRFGRLGATRKAAAVGKVMAVLFGLVGLVSFNFILVLIGVLVYFGASAETSSLEMRTSLSGIRIGTLADPRIGRVRPETPLGDLIELFLEQNLAAVRVGDGLSGPGAGYVTLSDLERVAKNGNRLSAGDVARKDIPRVRASEDAASVLGKASGRADAILVVDEAGEPAGIVTGKDFNRGAVLSHLLDDLTGGRGA